MPKYIKSHSNYVLSKKHENISDGTIWERDITTIGGVNQFAPSQMPIYKSSNFIITVRDDGKAANQFNKTKWKGNESGDTWTLENLSGLTSDFEEQNDLKIVLKQDYYDFCDFAYYGSLNELFRSSINDMLTRFPGELYGTDDNAYYTSAETVDFQRIEDRVLLGGSNYTAWSNPFGINLHSIKKPLDGDVLKYFADGGYKNYEVSFADYDEWKPIIDWEVTNITDPCNTCDCHRFKVWGTNTTIPYSGSDGNYLTVGGYTQLSCLDNIDAYADMSSYEWIIDVKAIDGQIKVMVTPIESTDEARSGEIIVDAILKDENGEIEECNGHTIRITQTPHQCTCDGFLYDFQNIPTLSYEGLTTSQQPIRICSCKEDMCYDWANMYQEFSEGEDWVEFERNRSQVYIVEALPNTDSSTRSATFRMCLPMSNGRICYSSFITISQEGNPCACNKFVKSFMTNIPPSGITSSNSFYVAQYSKDCFDLIGDITITNETGGTCEWVWIDNVSNEGVVFIKALENPVGVRKAKINFNGRAKVGSLTCTTSVTITQSEIGCDTCLQTITRLTVGYGGDNRKDIATACTVEATAVVDDAGEGWITISNTINQQTKTFYANIDPNSSTSPREANITVTIGNSCMKTIHVEQGGIDCTCSESSSYINLLEGDHHTFDANPGNVNFAIAEYETPIDNICKYGMFCTAEGTDWLGYGTGKTQNNHITVRITSVTENTTSEERHGRIILVPTINNIPCNDNISIINITQLASSTRLSKGIRGNTYLAKASIETKEEKYRRVADIKLTIKDEGYIDIYAYLGDNNDIVYLSKDGNGFEYHIRPKKEFLDKFYNECDNFERLLLNYNTTPKYKALFSVIKENDRGYYREMEEFTFPTSDGGYNIDASSYGFSDYTSRLAEIGAYYDEYFTDNLYRSMTHEAIKNFDWTFTREFVGNGEEEFIHGGEKIQKALRLFAREFDEILSYINNIKNTGRITYDERSNIPDYFLIDEAENNGWDVCMVYPYDLKEFSGNNETVDNYNDELFQLSGDGETIIIRNFSQNPSNGINPYRKELVKDFPDGYFVSCCKDEGTVTCQYSGSPYSFLSASDSGTTYYDKCSDGERHLRDRVKTFTDEREYTYFDANNEFIRRLTINSPHIWRHKGTVEGIEMLLGMFGLRSKQWVDTLKEKQTCSEWEADYDITEYSSFTHRIEEQWDAIHQMYRIDWINSTKAIVYDYRSTSNYTRYGADQTNYVPYQGLPVSYRDEYMSGGSEPYIKVSQLIPCSGQETTNDESLAFKVAETNEPVRRRYLYPNFNKNEQLDGNPYFQMGGGWLSKTVETSGGTNRYNFQFDVDDNIAYTKYEESGYTDSEDYIIDNHPIYKETIRNIKRVDNISELVSTPINTIMDGTIYYVSNIEDNVAIVNGEVFPINYEYNGTNSTSRYIVLTKGNEYIKIGDDLFFDMNIVVYDKNGSATTYDLSDKPSGFEIKAYIIKENDNSKFICQADDDGYYTIDSFCVLDEILNASAMTNYFVIDDSYYSNRIYGGSGDTGGWRPLKESDPEYIKINTIKNYYEGNNPHNGNMDYDGGHEYFTYYKRLFKNAIDEERFDERCYESFYTDLDDEIQYIGFHNLIEDNEMIRQYDTHLSSDSKIHYFGTYYKRTTEDDKPTSEAASAFTRCTQVKFYGENKEKKENLEKMYHYYNSGTSVSGYILCDEGVLSKGDNPYSGLTSTTYMCGDNVVSAITDEVTNQIVNNKRLTITFYLHNEWYSEKGQCELKYLDDIVMNYLTQMIPSSAIVDIRYVGKPTESGRNNSSSNNNQR